MSSLRLSQNRKWRIAIFSSVFCLMAGMVWRIADDEPRYQGHGLWHWYKLSNSTNTTEQAAGESAIRSMGTNVVPYLIKVLERGPSELNGWFAWASYKSSGTLPRWQPVHDHEDAAWMLGSIGTNAVAAAPALIESMKHHECSASSPAIASTTVAAIGPKALPLVLAAAQTNTNRNIRGNSINALPYFFWQNNAHTECFEIMLKTLLARPDKEVQEKILSVFRYNTDTSYSTPILIETLSTCSSNSFPVVVEAILHCHDYVAKAAIQDLQILRGSAGTEKQPYIDAATKHLLYQITTNKPPTLP